MAERPPDSSVDVLLYGIGKSRARWKGLSGAGAVKASSLEKMDFSSCMKYQAKWQRRTQECNCQMQGWRKQLCKHLVPAFSSSSGPELCIVTRS